jgi:predicted Zn-dependent protease
MAGRKLIGVGVMLLGGMTGVAQAQHSGGMHHSSWHGGHGGGGSLGQPRINHAQFAGFGGAGFYGGSYGGFYGGFYPMLAMGPGGFGPAFGWMGPPFMNGGPLLPPPPPDLIGPNRNLNRPRPVDPARSAQLTTLGDRLFRARNLKKAEERYNQAVRIAPGLALPRVRLGQVAMVRGQYGTAADCLREAETAQPGWILNAPDIQALYGEPTEFASNVAKLESYLQANPDDRDAWLVLGAEWFLSGRTNKAADVFKRLNDPNRKSDIALSAFLDASNQAGQKPPRPPDVNPPVP